jgi:RNA polymerase sigma factor (sigma-70 family)
LDVTAATEAPWKPGGDDDLAAVIERARDGDDTAFAELYARHVHTVRGYARRLADHEHAAEDLTAEAFTRTWEQLRAGAGPRTAFMAYVRAIVMNLHLRQLRRDARLSWVHDVEDAALADPERAARIAESSPEHLVLDRLLNDRIRHALATLPHHWQLVLVMVYVEGRPFKEVGAHLQLSAEASRQLAVRARRGMREALATSSSDGDSLHSLGR